MLRGVIGGWRLMWRIGSRRRKGGRSVIAAINDIVFNDVVNGVRMWWVHGVEGAVC